VKGNILTLMFLLVIRNSFGQSTKLVSDLLKYTTISSQSAQRLVPEKLYLQFDKPYYSVGDTVWLKVYLFNAASLMSSNKSGILYVDIVNNSNKIVKQYKLPVAFGLSWGNISLNEKDFNTGNYTLRAYTNWMRNFGEDCFFFSSFYITGIDETHWFVNTNFKASTINNDKKVEANLVLIDVNKVPYAGKPVKLKLMDGAKHLYKQTMQTDIKGALNFNFEFPAQASNINLIAEGDSGRKSVTIPVILNRSENADVQFLPEGGELVAGLPAHIGFKAIGEDGRGVAVSGTVINQAQNKITSFQTLHNGMGSFDLDVKNGERYTAIVNLSGGLTKEYPLPSVKSSGTVLQIKNPMTSDSLEVFFAANDKTIEADESYFLIGKSRGIICYAAVISFKNVNSLRKKIPKNLFPTGIAHFIVSNLKFQPLNERLTYIQHNDNLNIQLVTNKPAYGLRDSVSLNIKVTDNVGKPVLGNFSLSVTDDSQVKQNTLAGNLNTYMLLTSDLKGPVEQAGYYLSANNDDHWRALDNLLITQGWVTYEQKIVVDSSNFTFRPEHEFGIKGSVTNLFRKPVKGTDILLFSKSPFILKDTTTNDQGKFYFNHFPRTDTPIFVLKAINKNGKSFNVNINIDEISPPEFTKPIGPTIMPWYENSDSTLIKYTKTTNQMMLAKDIQAGTHLLKEVKITTKKFIKDSQNLNGPGNADVVIDEKELEAAGKKTWLQLMKEKVKGFNEGILLVQGHSRKAEIEGLLFLFITNHQRDNVNSPIKDWYFVDGKPIIFIVDGISVYEIYKPAGLAFTDITNYLNSHSAEDIKGIEVNFSIKYSTRYITGEWTDYAHPGDIAFVEITTRSGHGPAINNTAGMYLFKPLPISWPKQFYKPKYNISDSTKRFPDLRSTIDWEPNINTNADGEANVSFYAADKPSTYTVIMEGTDRIGNFGYKTMQISINKSYSKNE
jgi:hypothetical protein